MVKLLVGEAGSGKTKAMIHMANEAVDLAKGEIVYIESSSKHMHQLHRNIRFISTQDFALNTFNSLYGFLCGLVSENYDIEKIYIDGMDKVVGNITPIMIDFMKDINKFTDKYEIDMIISSSIDDPSLEQELKDYFITFDKVTV
ncbi:ABC-type phosphonate transport system ATPase subunit [Acetoanaerobium pronyense]|uniref:ABC-type phosphonate transport system ATPase subunit n=1 Tax=Acetoanaerobium pronyense TaxID=1482736 RepID=A0ABS4KGS4_9FIRM|nr:hypothetical protein [Acetoanaerobium pronyense]MBP2026973.1 ABC-type phosphonate transport system ATPase subunit [Acetoanaerobium pronyense]